MGRWRKFTPKNRKRRKCLRCLRRFMSDGPGNRRCRKCHTALEANDDLIEDVLDDGHKVAPHVDIDPPGFVT